MIHQMPSIGWRHFGAMLVALALLLTSAWAAFAEAETAPARTAAEKELDALTEAFLNTREEDSHLPWIEREWYAEWLADNGLTGDYEPSPEAYDVKEETEISDLALAAWEETCGITGENDFSMASEVYLFEHTLEGVTRQLWLVVRVHDDTMPDYYVLVDRASKKILAQSDAAEYKTALVSATAAAEAYRALSETAIQTARAALLEYYGNRAVRPVTEAYLDTCEFLTYQYSADEYDPESPLVWSVDVFSALENNGPEFTVTTDETGAQMLKRSWHIDAIPDSYTRAESDHARAVMEQLETLYLALEKEYLYNKMIPLADRAELYRQCAEILDKENLWDFLPLSPQMANTALMEHVQGLPGEGDISLEEAIEIVKKPLMDEYGLTQAQADAMVYAVWFYADPAPFPHIYRFSICLGYRTVYVAEVDAKSGKLRLLWENIPSQQSEADRQRETLVAQLGDWGFWSIEDKARYGSIYRNGSHPYGVPGDGELTYDQALILAYDALTQAYPALTREELESAAVTPYYIVEPYMLYNTLYATPIYYLGFHIGGDSLICYEIILDGKTGEVYLTHDPETSGNG